MDPQASRVVFLGPSLDVSAAVTRLDARYRPPIRRGDLSAAIADGATDIGIVDGEFGQSLAVSVMEIRAALQQGVRVWGAASMGALRAAECWRLGMVGVGWIFERYVDGALRSDDEVALLFDPRSLRPSTIPLVNIRWALPLAVADGVLTEAACVPVLDIARRHGFRTRSRETLLEAASGSPSAVDVRALLDYLDAHPLRTDRKRLDALLLLDAMRDWPMASERTTSAAS